MKEATGSARFDFYDAQYKRFGSELAAEMRREVYGEDIGQQGWRTVEEEAEFAAFLRLGRSSHVLDVACGSGGPSLALVERSGCRLTGVDIEPAGIAHAGAQTGARGLAGRATFAVLDCGGRLPFADETFDGVLCIDAVNHLPDRLGALSEWARLLRPGGRVLFTDSSVLTGPVANHELAVRASLGLHIFVAPGTNENAIAAASLVLTRAEDRTAATAEIAARWHAVRARHAAQLQLEEGAEWFGQRQHFLVTAAELAQSRRLSRFLYTAEKPA